MCVSQLLKTYQVLGPLLCIAMIYSCFPRQCLPFKALGHAHTLIRKQDWMLEKSLDSSWLKGLTYSEINLKWNTGYCPTFSYPHVLTHLRLESKGYVRPSLGHGASLWSPNQGVPLLQWHNLTTAIHPLTYKLTNTQPTVLHKILFHVVHLCCHKAPQDVCWHFTVGPAQCDQWIITGPTS